MVFRSTGEPVRMPAMAFDPDALPAATKKKLIELGKQFGSQDTLDQANQTLNALAKYGAALSDHGFPDSDTERLRIVRDLLIQAGVGRETAKGQKKVTSAAYTAAMVAAQAARLSARAVLEGVHGDLEESAEEEAARRVAAVLEQTAAAPEEAEPLALQLDRLRAALSAAEVSAAAASRGGQAALGRLSNAAAALRAADQNDAGVRGTPQETERLDLLDGLIVRLTRRARKAALAAAKATGNLALAAAFRLDKLYRSRGGAAAGEEEPPEDEPNEGGGVTEGAKKSGG
jgi:hypothetical protein